MCLFMFKVISETKLDESFPVGQFLIPGYTSHFRLDRDQHDGGIMVFIREDIPDKRKWLLSC